VASDDIQTLRDSQVTVSAGLSNLHFILRMRRAKFEADLAPLRQAALPLMEGKVTDKSREMFLRAHPDCKPLIERIDLLDMLVDNLEAQRQTADYRMRMISEKSYASRKLD
jgi:hypothetical protein